MPHGLLAACLVVGILACAQSAEASQSQSRTAKLTPPLSAVEVFQAASPGIVTVETPSSFGSGIVIDASGTVLTNLHVIAGASRVSVALANHDVYEDVSILAFDVRRDLVLLKLSGFGLKSVALGDSDETRIGHRVYAIGAPKGLQLTISEGIISSIREADGYRVIQTTAPISPGSSGGGLFDAAGRLIGVTTSLIEGGQNLNFAVPINYARGLLSASSGSLTLAELQRRIGIVEEKPVSKAAQPTVTPSDPRFRGLMGASFGTVQRRLGSPSSNFSYDARRETWFYGDFEVRFVDRRVVAILVY